MLEVVYSHAPEVVAQNIHEAESSKKLRRQYLAKQVSFGYY